ncbi:MAG: hypothetical protein IJ057_10275 [Bacteroidales bacterium]|nr:hypothetical protein [Bacteroidales bacterium]
MDKKEQKISPIKQRILQFADNLGISKREFYTKIGVSRGTLEANTGITEDVLAKFIAIYPEVSVIWLVTGEGEMLKPKVQDQLVLPSLQSSQSAENQCKDNENNPMMAEASENIKSLIGILSRTLIEKDKQIESLLTIIKQGKV